VLFCLASDRLAQQLCITGAASAGARKDGRTARAEPQNSREGARTHAHPCLSDREQPRRLAPPPPAHASRPARCDPPAASPAAPHGRRHARFAPTSQQRYAGLKLRAARYARHTPSELGRVCPGTCTCSAPMVTASSLFVLAFCLPRHPPRNPAEPEDYVLQPSVSVTMCLLQGTPEIRQYGFWVVLFGCPFAEWHHPDRRNEAAAVLRRRRQGESRRPRRAGRRSYGASDASAYPVCPSRGGTGSGAALAGQTLLDSVVCAVWTAARASWSLGPSPALGGPRSAGLRRGASGGAAGLMAAPDHLLASSRV
jgi:hypothetical protein